MPAVPFLRQPDPEGNATVHDTSERVASASLAVLIRVIPLQLLREKRHRALQTPAAGTLAHWFLARVEGGRGRIRKITAGALARKLIVALWKYVTVGLIPEGARLKSV